MKTFLFANYALSPSIEVFETPVKRHLTQTTGFSKNIRMFKILMRTFCGAALAGVSVHAIPIDIDVNAVMSPNRPIRGFGVWKVMAEPFNKKDHGGKNDRKEAKSPQKEKQNFAQGGREPYVATAGLNRPICLWNSVGDPEQPIAARIEALKGEGIGLWNAVGSPKLLAAAWQRARADESEANTGVATGNSSEANTGVATGNFSDLELSFASGSGKDSIYRQSQEWVQSESRGKIAVAGANVSHGGFSSMPAASLAGELAVPDSAATFLLLGIGFAAVAALRKRCALVATGVVDL